MQLQQGDIIWIDLNPAKGTEIKKTRRCLVVSNEHYNRHFNTIIIVPISSSKKYLTEEKYLQSPMFITIQQEKVHSTALLQHLRAIDPTKRTNCRVVARLEPNKVTQISTIIKQFY
ncbi:type II toxin-antitoxin system PemK/MazF family toxin [Lactobacillus sp. ESL0684]|uniref:type II toxin-antitoxin system PemK/MazF family toxin n=1 Tax=Lactobacillus sp. ESL0684 TaxID=2983213 RepID=UPI0023F621B8|nr:type II toxin-antitoxin system PemK/MazF family toxin [Lactobacillus sp. ESL0684]WEV43857.1 type II toxin-antitoxin system PemK/MazF family toxin [Lactobacillus sp. ESL0684]